jgi:IclR family mhp operon transcriptional activator
MSVMGIARRELLPYPTACRIVQTLVHEGLIEQEPTRKRYRPTVLVQSLALGVRSGSQLVSTARPHLEDLTRRIGWPVFISVRVGAHMVVRDSTHAMTSLSYGDCHPGFTVPLFQSATGHVYLAALSASELEDLVTWVDIGNKELWFKIDTRELRMTLDKVRLSGFAAKECHNGNAERSASVAVPLYRGGRIEAVLTMCYFYSAMSESAAIERYMGAMLSASQAISTALSPEGG